MARQNVVYEVRLPLTDWLFIVSADSPRKAMKHVFKQLSGGFAEDGEPFEIAAHRAPKLGDGVWKLGKQRTGRMTKDGIIYLNK